MKKESTSKSAPARRSLGEGGFFNVRFLFACVLCLFGVFVALLSFGAFSNLFAQTRGSKQVGTAAKQDAPGTQTPEVTQLVGPVSTTHIVRDLPYIPPAPRLSGAPLKPFRPTGTPPPEETSAFPQFQSLLGKIFQQVPKIPEPLLTFDGVAFAQSGCSCEPPDTNGDVGPNHYVEAVNSSFKVFDKNGNTLAGPTTFNSLFAPLTGTPCSGQNRGDPFAFYDHLANRWVISDFAFATFGGSPSYECIAVSQTPDPAGLYFVYALLIDPTDANDYPKAAMWNNPTPGGAYHFTYNMWASLQGPFTGVKVQALDRGAMLAGQQNPTVITFKIPLAGLTPDVAYSLVPASFRTGNPPPASRDEMLLAVRSGNSAPATFSDVLGWLFHVDFVTPANSTLGIGPDHSANAMISVNTFTEAWINNPQTPFALVPQQGTSAKLDSLGDKIMTPVVYQNRNGTESLWADQTTILNFPNGPTVVSWYQFDVTGGNFPATPVQEQAWSNGNDGLWRFMPSVAVDQNGNTAIGYAVSNGSVFPGIRYAGRLASDPPANLAQGEAVMFTGTGSQTGNRWGDYSMTTLDTDGMTFWHANEHYTTTSNFNWHTRIGKFNFQGGGGSPTPTPTATPAVCSWAAGPNMPSTGTRMVGIYFVPNGKFYAMGGRSTDGVGNDFMHPFEYDPVGNSWVMKAGTYPDNQVNNMGCGVLSESGIPYIYCVGGSAGGQTTATGRVFRYNPVTDMVSTVPAPWPPGAQNVLAGGFAVVNNKLYIMGGFQINTQMINQTWEFDPATLSWTQKANMPVARGYIPATAIGTNIYTAGGSTCTKCMTDLADTNDSFKYDVITNSWSAITNIPRITAETRALTFCNKVYVMGGGRTTPNPSNEVDVYDPSTNTWSTGLPFITARRNFPTGTDGTNHIWLSGGYDTGGFTTLATMEIFNCPVSPCGPSPTPTPTATAIATATATATATPMATATATATASATATATPRATPTPRPRPTPAPRP